MIFHVYEASATPGVPQTKGDMCVCMGPLILNRLGGMAGSVFMESIDFELEIKLLCLDAWILFDFGRLWSLWSSRGATS